MADGNAAGSPRLGLALLVSGTLLTALIIVAAYVTATYGTLDYKCAVEGPDSPLAEVSERSGIVHGWFSLWPLGRACDWVRADGRGWVTALPGWADTTCVLATAALALLGVRILWTAGRRS